MDCWYKVTILKAHMGAGRNDSVNVYIYAKDVVEVLEIEQKGLGIIFNSFKAA